MRRRNLAVREGFCYVTREKASNAVYRLAAFQRRRFGASFCEGRFGSKAPFHGSDRNRTGGPRAYRQSDGLPGRFVVGALAAGARGLQTGRMVP